MPIPGVKHPKWQWVAWWAKCFLAVAALLGAGATMYDKLALNSTSSWIFVLSWSVLLLGSAGQLFADFFERRNQRELRMPLDLLGCVHVLHQVVCDDRHLLTTQDRKDLAVESRRLKMCR